MENKIFEITKFYIARDSEGELYLYDHEPKKLRTCFMPQSNKSFMEMPSDLFPEIVFNNSPQEVELFRFNYRGK